jgi:hypothetical protein
MKYLGIDVGASLSKTGLISEDWKEVLKDYSNKVWSHDGEANTKDYDLDVTKPENVLDLSIKFGDGEVSSFDKEVKKIVSTIENQRWILGKLAEDMSSTHQSLASDSLKVVQEEFYLNILGVVYSTVLENKIKAKELTLGVLVPPRDYFHDLKDVLFGVLAREITITNNTTGEKVVVKFTKDTIVVKPESVVAFAACFVNDENEITEAGEKYGELLNISIDMGHSTTDLAIMEEWKPKKNSFKTMDVATSQLLGYLSAEIQRKFSGYIPPEKELVKAFHSGKLTTGATEQWVGDEITLANKKFAMELYSAMHSYLTANGLRFQQVASFMFSGGGSVELKNVQSVRSFFMDEVKKVSQFTDSFTPEQYLSIKTHVDFEAKKDKLAVVRYSNILGFMRGLRDRKATDEEK